MDIVGLSAQGVFGIAQEAQDRQRDTRETCEPFGHARPARPVAILVPPPVLAEEVALDVPMAAHVPEKLRASDTFGSEAGEKIARVVQLHGAVSGDHIAVDAQGDLATGEAEGVAQIRDVL